LMFIARLYLTLPWFVFVGLISKRAGVLRVWLVFLVVCYTSYKTQHMFGITKWSTTTPDHVSY